MKTKQITKYVVDIVMTLALICLMAYQVTGEALHEWIGIGMTVILIVHHILNIKWYSALFKGKYNAYRIISTITNTLLLASIALTAFCGMSMSSHAVPFLYGMSDMVFARTTHLALSFWSFILMGFHLGLHLPTITAKVKPNKTVKIICTVLFTMLAGVGLWLFIKNGIPNYIFFKTHFAFLDYDKAAVLVFLENLTIEFFFAFLGVNIVRFIRSLNKKAEPKKNPLVPIVCVLLAVLIGVIPNLITPKSSTTPGWDVPQNVPSDSTDTNEEAESSTENGENAMNPEDVKDGFILINGGTFLMGSPESENWRIDDETQHSVTVSAFYIDKYETTQKEYARITGENPSTFKGDDLPVENITWLDAIRFANAKSKNAGLTPAYTINENGVTWDRAANGYRLPTEAEWEYACRNGTVTPFNTEKSLDADDANFYGHYPYEIEENYFNDSVLEARPGVYRQTTVAVGSFYESRWGLYDMHGNVNEWCWDYYGAYDVSAADNPSGALTGTRHIYRGDGWNDFGKNMRSAYRAAGQSDYAFSSVGVRLVRNAGEGNSQKITAAERVPDVQANGKTLIVFFSWSGNTRGIAKEIQKQTGADLFEITLVHPYSTNYNTVLMEAQEDQHKNARPEIVDPPKNIDEYDTVILGYPNWWASIPMPIATFLESYDFSGKTIVPFCSHGGGRFGQSLTAIAKLAPDAKMGEGLSVHYSGGSTLSKDITEWLKNNNFG